MAVRPITFGDEGQVASREMLKRFDALQPPPPKSLRAQLSTLEALDRQYGGSGALALEGLDELVASILTELVKLPLPRPSAVRSIPQRGPRGEGETLPDLIIAVALWAIRHEVAITVVEPVVNALAERANNAA